MICIFTNLEPDIVAEQVEEVDEVGAATLVWEQLVVHDLTHPDLYLYLYLYLLFYLCLYF